MSSWPTLVTGATGDTGRPRGLMQQHDDDQGTMIGKRHRKTRGNAVEKAPSRFVAPCDPLLAGTCRTLRARS